MTNAEKYHFADFTRENYRKILKLAKTTWEFREYATFDNSSRQIIWRHDVDYSPHSSLKLAEIEASEGIVSTYFILPHSEYYNLLESEIRDIFQKIHQLGHRLGVHLDCYYHGIQDVDSMIEPLKWEKNLIEATVGSGCVVDSFSFHTPNDFLLSCVDTQYAGLFNAYAKMFRGEVGYCSDSNGYWRHRRLEDVLVGAQDYSLQVLTHPEWWTDTVMSPLERVNRCCDIRSEKSKERYLRLLKEWGRPNIK